MSDPLLPITWKGWDGDLECMIYYNVTWLEDFGPFKKGENVPTLVGYKAGSSNSMEIR